MSYPSMDSRQKNRWYLLLAGAIGLAGLAAFGLYLNRLYFIWTDNALMSIGMLVPPVCIWLCWRAWLGHSWNVERDGSWWGLVLAGGAILVAQVANPTIPGISLSPRIGLAFPPVGVLLWTYVSGIVLLVGGPKAWKKAWFPIALLLLVKPVPSFFPELVDLPLQNLAARTARGFAQLLGMALGGQNLEMMFAPSFGMFIAPGCNGLRGSIAMGFVALVMGYLYKLRPFGHAAFVAAAVLLGYVFNLLRLCGLVIFYWVALRVTSLEPHAEAADYVIGGILFFIAARFLFGAPRRLVPARKANMLEVSA